MRKFVICNPRIQFFTVGLLLLLYFFSYGIPFFFTFPEIVWKFGERVKAIGYVLIILESMIRFIFPIFICTITGFVVRIFKMKREFKLGAFWSMVFLGSFIEIYRGMEYLHNLRFLKESVIMNTSGIKITLMTIIFHIIGVIAGFLIGVKLGQLVSTKKEHIRIIV